MSVRFLADIVATQRVDVFYADGRGFPDAAKSLLVTAVGDAQMFVGVRFEGRSPPQPVRAITARFQYQIVCAVFAGIVAI